MSDLGLPHSVQGDKLPICACVRDLGVAQKKKKQELGVRRFFRLPFTTGFYTMDGRNPVRTAFKLCEAKQRLLVFS